MEKFKEQIPGMGRVFPAIPGMGETQEQTARYLFGAIMAAGKSQCTCEVCQLMRKVSDSLVSDLLKEGGNARD